jgi:hypothetical protein
MSWQNRKIEITHSVAVVEISPLALLQANVVADGFEYANELFIEMARMHGAALPGVQRTSRKRLDSDLASAFNVCELLPIASRCPSHVEIRM